MCHAQLIEDRLQVFGAGLGRVGRRPAAEATAAATTAATLRAGGQHAAHREGERQTRTSRQIVERTSDPPSASESWPLVDDEIERLVAELDDAG